MRDVILIYVHLGYLNGCYHVSIINSNISIGTRETGVCVLVLKWITPQFFYGDMVMNGGQCRVMGMHNHNLFEYTLFE